MKRRKDHPARKRKGSSPQRVRSAAREIRPWRYPLVVLGILHIIASGWLDPSWGIILILVGLACFHFVDASMFVVIGVTVGRAGIQNALSGRLGWILFAVTQFLVAIVSFHHFFSHRKAQASLRNSDPDRWRKLQAVRERSARVFPAVGLMLSCLGVLGLVLGILLAAFSAPPRATSLVEGLAVNLAVLSLAVCLSSLLSGFRPRGLAIAGGVASTLILALYVVLQMVARRL